VTVTVPGVEAPQALIAVYLKLSDPTDPPDGYPLAGVYVIEVPPEVTLVVPLWGGVETDTLVTLVGDVRPPVILSETGSLLES
jgi:hypothetical protein